jgi:hypothetical protein
MLASQVEDQDCVAWKTGQINRSRTKKDYVFIVDEEANDTALLHNTRDSDFDPNDMVGSYFDLIDGDGDLNADDVKKGWVLGEQCQNFIWESKEKVCKCEDS